MNLRRWFRSLEPRAMGLLHGPMGERIRPWVDAHDVLNFGRHSLAKGVGFGLLCGLLPLGPIQMAATVLLCVRWRGNALAGMVTTLYSNVFTIVPLYLLAFQMGSRLLGVDAPSPDMAALTQSEGLLSGSWQAVTAMGLPIVVGVPMLGVLLGLVGYAFVHTAWLWPVWWRARRMRRLAQVR